MTVQVTSKEIVINPNFVSKHDAKFYSNSMSRMIRNDNSKYGSDANKLGQLTPDIAVQIKAAPWRKDRFSQNPFKELPDIWSIKPRHQNGALFPMD